MNTLLLCTLVCLADGPAFDPLGWAFAAEPPRAVHARFVEAMAALDERTQASYGEARATYRAVLEAREADLRDQVSSAGRKGRAAAAELAMVQIALSLLRPTFGATDREGRLDIAWIDPEHAVAWVIASEQKVELRTLADRKVVGTGRWWPKGRDHTILCHLEEAGPYETRQGFFALVLPESLAGRSARAQLYTHPKSNQDWRTSPLVPHRWTDRGVRKATTAYLEVLDELRRSHTERAAELSATLERDLESAKEALLADREGLDMDHVAEVEEAIAQLGRSRLDLSSELLRRKWRNEKQTSSEWVFAKEGRLFFTRGTHKGQGRWQVVDRSVALCTLRGCFVLDFDLGVERAHSEGVNGDGSPNDEAMVPRED